MWRRQPLWSSGQSSWLHIQRSGFDSLSYQTFWEVMGLERGPLSLVSTTEELLGRKSRGSVLESREYCRRDPSRWPRGTFYLQKLALTTPIRGGRSVVIVRSRTQATEMFITWRICETVRPKRIRRFLTPFKVYMHPYSLSGFFSVISPQLAPLKFLVVLVLN
jgi:hypothetical protein